MTRATLTPDLSAWLVDGEQYASLARIESAHPHDPAGGARDDLVAAAVDYAGCLMDDGKSREDAITESALQFGLLRGEVADASEGAL